MNFLNIVRNTIFFLLTTFVFTTPAVAQESCYYLFAEAGISIPRKLHLNPPLPWDPAIEGYSKKLRNSEVLGGGLGYNFCPLFSAELELNHRNSYKYKKFQTAATVTGNKIRYFNFRNTTIMGNLLIHGRGLHTCLSYETPTFSIDPIINLGLGPSYNTIHNFHSLQTSTGTVFSMMQPYTKISLAYQLGIGLEILSCDLLSFGLGYRYLETGRIRSNDYIIDNPDSPGTTSGRVAPSWRGKFKTNELYIKLLFPI